jgi:hypothetical protein
MAETSRNIKVTELDFDEIKKNIKTYLKAQNAFTDYNFEGSGLSILLDILAYNTHYNALYYNLSVNEMFLDSAVKRSSVVSLAKLLGYTPTSSVASRAIIDIVASNVTGNPTTLTIPAGTIFQSNLVGANYNFSTESAITVSRSVSNTYTFLNVPIIEGKLLQKTYSMVNNGTYTLPNTKVDTSTIKVNVQEVAGSAANTVYTLSENFASLNPTSRVYFLKENDEGNYVISFGDGLLGFAPANGANIIIDYFVCNEEEPNGTSTFTYTGSAFTNTANLSIVTKAIAAGGSIPETIDSIKFNAPKNFTAQNRAVTAQDYKTIIPKFYNNVDAISVWGGEENDPPTYGKAYICIKPKTGDTLTQSTKQIIIKDIIKSKSLVSIIPEIVDPEILFISVNSSVYYNPKITTRSSDTIKSIVIDTIKNFNTSNLNKFDSVFRESALSTLIDTSESSIVSNITKISLKYVLTPQFNTNTKYTLQLNNPIYRPTSTENASISLLSSGFKIAGDNNTYYIEDNAIGNLRLFYLTGQNVKIYTPSYVGTVNYTIGKILIDSINITQGDNNSKVVFTVEPASYDVISVRNQLTFIREQDIEVNIISDKIASGESVSGKDFIFTPSR